MKASAIVAAIGVGVLATALAKPANLPNGWLQTGPAKTCEGQVVPASGAPSPKVFSLDCKPGTELHAGLKDWALENIYDISRSAAATTPASACG